MLFSFEYTQIKCFKNSKLANKMDGAYLFQS